MTAQGREDPHQNIIFKLRYSKSHGNSKHAPIFLYVPLFLPTCSYSALFAPVPQNMVVALKVKEAKSQHW